MSTEEARALWVKALRSGEYKQTTGQLRKVGNYCCLGVACDLYDKHVLKGDGWKQFKANNMSYTFLGQGGALPYQVQEWLGLERSSHFGELKDGTNLMYMNDDPEYKEGFNGIADVIEKGELLLEWKKDND